MIEKTLERIADALEENNRLQKEALQFRRQMAGDVAAEPVAAVAVTKEGKTPKPPKEKTAPAPATEPTPEPEPDGLTESEEAVTKASIRQFHIDTSAKGADEAAKVKAFFVPALIEFGALKADGKPNIDALPEDRYAEFMAAFRAAVA